MLDIDDAATLWLTLRLAFTVTLLLLALGTPLAWWLARTRSRARHVVGAIVALPLVLPPTVLGFYLLLALGPQGWLGQLTGTTGKPEYREQHCTGDGSRHLWFGKRIAHNGLQKSTGQAKHSTNHDGDKRARKS